MLQSAFERLPSNVQAIVWHDYESHRKSGGLSYVLWLCFGFHYLYLGQLGLQLLYWLTFGGFGLWAIIDLLRIPGMVEQKNEAILLQIMAHYQTAPR